MNRIQARNEFRIPGTNIIVESGDFISVKSKARVQEGSGSGVSISLNNAEFTQSQQSDFEFNITGEVIFESYYAVMSTSDVQTDEEVKGTLTFDQDQLLKDAMNSPAMYWLIDEASGKVEDFEEEVRNTLYLADVNSVDPTMYGEGFIHSDLTPENYIDISAAELYITFELNGEEYDMEFSTSAGSINFNATTCYTYQKLWED